MFNSYRSNSAVRAVVISTCAFGLTFAAEAQGVLINLQYTPAFLAADPMGHRQAVVRQAADNWQNAITHPFTLDVVIDWGIPDHTACGQGGVTMIQMVPDGLGAGGMIEVPRNGYIILSSVVPNWFVDLTPADNSEFDPVHNQPWHGTAKPLGGSGGNATDKVDMLSCAKHEFGHTLGFHFDMPAAFNPYNFEVADGDIDLIGDYAGTSIPNGVGTNNDKSHYDPMAVVPGIPVADLLMVTGSPVPDDDRTAMSPWDVNGIAAVLGLPAAGYNMVPKSQVPEPTTLMMVLVAGILTMSRSRRE